MGTLPEDVAGGKVIEGPLPAIFTRTRRGTLAYLQNGADKLDLSATYLLPIPREMLLVYLPGGGDIAEVGVAEGDFSAKILEHCTPRSLALIDLWAHQDDAEYKLDLNNVADHEQERRCRAVRDRFAAQCDSGLVSIIRGDSVAAASSFADRTFDFVYIDGNHTYQGVRRDLEAYYPKVKDDGFICGHDFSNHESARELGFDVVRAVCDFCRERGCFLCAITAQEDFLSFVAAKRPGPHVEMFLLKLLYTVPGVVAVRNFINRDFEHILFRFSDGRQNLVVTI